jgi:ATP-dependent Clp protease ATP-binding subunit ClpA
MGGLVTCRSAMIIFTSNAGAARAATVKSLDSRIGFSGGGDDPSTREDYVKGMSRAIDDGMVRHFPPEFRNRLDAIVSFAPIRLDTARAVSRKLLDDLTRRVTLRHKVVVTFTDRLVEMITRRGYDVEYGARNIIRTIDTLVKTAIADQFAAAPHGEDAPRDMMLDADADDAVVVARREDHQDDDAWAGFKAG